AGGAAPGGGHPAGPAPAATSANVTSTAVASFSLVSNMVFSTPSVRAATLAGTTVVAACPPANRFAALTVLDANVTGTHAEAAEGQVAAARIASGPRPRCTSPARNGTRPGSSRSFKVDFATPRCAAAWSCVWPAR